MRKVVSQYINGIFTSNTKETKALYNPATGQEINQIVYASEQEISEAISSSQTAFVTWSQSTVQERLEVLGQFEQRIIKHRNDIARHMMEEEGKSYSAAQVDIQLLLTHLCSVLTQPNLFLNYSVVERDIEKQEMLSPLGVTAFICTPEFPSLAGLWLVPIALAMGNTCIIKASETAPSATLMLADILTQSGLPAGAINVIQGDHFIADHVIRSEGVQAIVSIASSPVFLEQMQLAHLTGKKVQQIMRPWSLSVVAEDADVNRAVEGIVQSMFAVPNAFSASVSILNSSNVVAVGSIADRILPRLKARMSQFKIGPAQENAITIGPLSSEQHLHQMRNCIDKAVNEGAKLILDGRKAYVRGYENGYFMNSSLLDNVNPNMSLFKEDLTAPILSVHRVSDLNEAKNLVSKVSTPTTGEPASNLRGLQASCAIYSEDLKAARDFALSMPVTLVSVNGKTTTHYLAHSGGRAVVMDVALPSTYAFCREFFTRYKALNIFWSEPIE